MAKNIKPIYQRILLKLSGEALQGKENFGIDANVLDRIAKEIKELVELGIQLGIVVGGGNLFRGSDLTKVGINHVLGDYIGMLATIINGIAIYDALHRSYVNAYIMSAIPLNNICNNYNRIKAINLLSNNCVVIFTAGTGNPLFTTDSAACLRGIEIEADILLKATKVDGVFSDDPIKCQNVILYDKLNYQEVLDRELRVMDLIAFNLGRDHNLPICIFNINTPGALLRVVMGNKEGTLITN